MKHLFFVLAFCIGLFNYGQEAKDSASVDALVKQLAEYDMVTNYSSGFAGLISPQYVLFMKLKKKASAEELVALTDHESPVVRSYAFWALANHKEINRGEIQKVHANDNAKVVFLYGCVAEDTTVAALMNRLRYTPMFDDEQKKSDIKIIESGSVRN